MDYTVKYASKIAERFKKGSITNPAAGNEFKFTGARSVKLYSMVTADVVDYDRGGKRYGDVTDLEFNTQEMICTQAKSFTKHLEVLDNSDISVDATAGKFLRTQLDEKVIPLMDKYRLKKWLMGGATLKQMSTAPTKNTIVGDIMSLKGMMGDNLVPDNALTLYIGTTYYIMLKNADAVVATDGYNRKAIEKGVVGEFDGMKVVPVPSTWLPSGCYFMIKAKGTSCDPVKLAQYDIIPKSVGYSGPVVQGLAYYDAFVIGTKNVGIGIAGSPSCVLNAPALKITSGVVTATAVAGVTFYATTDGTDPRWSTTRVALGTGVTLTEGQTARVIGEKDGCVMLEATQAYAA